MTGPAPTGTFRDHNRALVLRALQELGPSTRPRLVDRTGLSRAAVANLVAEQVRRGVVVEVEQTEQPAGAGRPARLVALTASLGLVAGIDLGHSHVRAAIATTDGEVRGEAARDLAVDVAPSAAFDLAVELLDEVLRSHGHDRSEVQAIGAGIPSPVDPRTGRVSSNNILPHWVDVDPAAELGRRTGGRVVVDNDANLGALAETRFGVGRDVDSLVHIKASSGIGAGLVLDGALYRAHTGTAGEIGHVQVREDGRVCRCGSRGCLETFASVPRIIDDLRDTHPDLSTPRDLVALLHAGDLGVGRVVGDAGRAIGRVVADLCAVLSPSVVVVGGELGACGDAFLDPIRAMVQRHTQPMISEALTVVPSTFDDRNEVLGALALASQAVFAA